ncbi:MAG: CHAP domain-containing protein [Bacilli bacterium]|nr:CHAP domain-containing protein [Bacilli bacterium]
MKRKIKIALVLFLLLMIPFGVKAEKITCSRIMNEHENYLQYKDQFDSINCNDIDSSEKAAKCTDLSTNINSSLQFLYNSVDSYPNCSTSEIQTTLNDNDTNCKSVYQTDMKETTKKIMTFFYVVAPFLLILFGSIDLTKIVSANDPEGMKKAKSNLTKRVIAFLLIYILPLFVNLSLSFVSNEYKLDGNYYSCKTQYYSYQQKFSSRYSTRRSSSSVTLSGAFNGKYTIRDSAPGMGDIYYYSFNNTNSVYSNTGQCVWYARSRAKEIVAEIAKNNGMSQERADKLMQILDSDCGDGGQWLEVGQDMGFKTSTNVADVAAPALISWKQDGGAGHVAVIESVDNGKVVMSEGWSSTSLTSCPSTWDCVRFSKDEYTIDEWINGKGAGYTSGSGTKYFSGYVFFTELEGE